MVHIQDLSLAFGEQVLFEHLDLTLLPNEWVSLLGCSGVGKSTLLRLIAGLDIQGKVQGNIISNPNIKVAWIPQKNTLYPWLSIVDNVQLENVLFGNKSAKTTIRAGMSEHLQKNCAQLSVGQKQRVALDRVLMQNADLVLLDEPFSALDAISRYQLQNLVYELLKDKSVLLVTHDPQEALRLSQRIFVLRSPQPNQPALSDVIKPEGKAPRELNQENLWMLQQQLLNELLEGKR